MREKSYVRCENHKNETFWKKYDQRIVLAEKKTAKKTRQNEEEEGKKRQNTEGEAKWREKRKKLCNRPMILVVARADPLRIWKNCFRYEWTLSMWPWTPSTVSRLCRFFARLGIDVLVLLIVIRLLLFCGAKAFNEINNRCFLVCRWMDESV